MLLLLGIVGAWYSAGYVLNRPAKQQNLVYDHRCEDRPVAIITNRLRLFRTSEREPVSIEEIEIFVHYIDYFEDVFEFFQVTALGRNPERLKAYFNQSDHLIPIGEVTLAKWLPPDMNGLNREYLGVTMGVFDAVGDLNNDGISEIVVGTADTRCSEDRRDYLVFSGDRLISDEKVRLEEVATRLTSPKWKQADEAPVIHNIGIRMNKKMWLFNGHLANASTRMQGLDSLSLEQSGTDLGISDNALFIDGAIVDWSDGGLRIAVEPETLKEMVRVELPPDVDSPNGIAMIPESTLPDSSEVVLVSRSHLSVFDFRRGETLLAIDIDEHTTVDMLVGSYGDFDQDEVQDFWISFPNAQNDQGDIVGVSYLISGERLRGAVREGGRTSLTDLVYAALRGDPGIPTRQKSGVGYDISLKAGDIDGDKLPDFVTVAHHTYDNAGSLYVLPGKHVSEGAEYTALSNEVIQVLGAPLSYLGTGLHVGDDWDRDGFDDIVVGADVDHESGFNAGAIYLLSGKEITERQTEQ